MKGHRRVALVTGAAGGIGSAMVRSLSRHYAVLATDLHVPSRRGRAALAFRMDVRSEASVRSARDLVHERYAGLDALVYCAGVSKPAGLLLSRPEDWEETFGVNVLGAARCLRILGELLLRSRPATAVLVGSLSAERPFPGGAAYASSKAALESLGRTAAVELQQLGIRVLTLSPSWVDTPMTRSLGSKPGRRWRERSAADPLEVAQLTATLLEVPFQVLAGAHIPLPGASGPREGGSH